MKILGGGEDWWILVGKKGGNLIWIDDIKIQIFSWV